MSLKRVGILLRKELWQGPKSFIFIWGIAGPIAISLVVSLVFGTLFSQEPRLGIADQGGSELVALARSVDSIATREYATVTQLKQATENGAVDMGIVLPEGFDDAVSAGEPTEITAYVWGESLAKNRIVLVVTISDLTRELSGQQTPIEIESVTLGDETNIPWSDRLLPLIVLMAVFFAGMTLPATSIITERQEGTLQALVVTPTTLEDVILSKALVGVGLSLCMGVLILVINQAFGAQPLLLVLVLALGSVMAAEVGILLGTLFKDVTTMFAAVKSLGILLFAPVLIYLFPQIPQWVGQLFPTYYIVQPIVDISQQGAGWADISTNVLILGALDVVLAGVAVYLIARLKQR